MSNPIFVGRSESEGPPTVPTDGGYELNPDAWRTEQHSDAEARLGSNDGIVTFAYALGNSPGTYAAIAYSLERSDIELDGFIDFVVSASKPMRISAQLRRGASRDYRWRHSFYVDQRARRIQLPIRDFASVGLTIGSGGAAADIDSLLFVADTVNHDRNASGELHISQLRIRD